MAQTPAEKRVRSRKVARNNNWRIDHSGYEEGFEPRPRLLDAIAMKQE